MSEEDEEMEKLEKLVDQLIKNLEVMIEED